MLKWHAAHGAQLCSQGIVYLHDGFPGDKRLEFFRTEQAFEITPSVADCLALKQLQALDGRVEEVKATAHERFTAS
jgi:hypothetical protein